MGASGPVLYNTPISYYSRIKFLEGHIWANLDGISSPSIASDTSRGETAVQITSRRFEYVFKTPRLDLNNDE